MSAHKNTAWVNHVKAYCKEHNMTYGEALTKAKPSYLMLKGPVAIANESKKTDEYKQDVAFVKKVGRKKKVRKDVSKHPWLIHCKQYSAKHNKPYSECLSSKECRAEYKSNKK